MKKNIIIALLVAFITPFLSGVSPAILTPVADGHYHYGYCCNPHPIQVEICEYYSHIYTGIEVYAEYDYIPLMCFVTYDEGIGIIEFDISLIDGLFTSTQMKALLTLMVKEGNLPSDSCLTLYSIDDANENGMIEEVDIDTDDFIGEICEDLQPGDIITFDVTTAIEHDLFDPDQTNFSGFVIDKSTYYQWVDDIEFYDHTDITNAPRLSISSLAECTLNDDCEDDELFCNGEEICVEEKCMSEGDPCPPGRICIEQLDFCEEQHTTTIPTTTTTEKPPPSTTTTTTTIPTTTTTEKSPPSTTTTTTTCACPIICSYGEFVEETELLRSLRDNVLSKTHEGRELIKLYYQWSPVIVKAMEADEEFKEDMREMVDEILPMIE
jgi:hypothetical protein